MKSFLCRFTAVSVVLVLLTTLSLLVVVSVDSLQCTKLCLYRSSVARYYSNNLTLFAEPRRRVSAVSSAVGQSRSKSEVQVQGTRLNKCLTGLSRRAADEAIEGGRVTVNGAPARCGTKVLFGDKVRLDGQLQRWEQLQRAKTSEAALLLEDRKFAYLKYWKPAGVTSTSDPTDSSNIIAAGKFHLFPQRLFSVGRLDKDSTGLILMTSDGRVNNALLSSALKKEKVYEVTLNRVPSDAHVQQLAEGVAITTTAQRDGRARDLTRATLPCKVTRMGGPESRRLQFVLVEGRNRQIRKMVESIGYEVVALHRTAFAGITLKGLSCGNWAELNEKEMLVVQRAVETAAARTSEQSAADGDDEDFD